MRPASKVVVGARRSPPRDITGNYVHTIGDIFLAGAGELSRGTKERSYQRRTDSLRQFPNRARPTEDQRMAPRSARDELTVERVERLLFSTPKPKHGQSKKLQRKQNHRGLSRSPASLGLGQAWFVRPRLSTVGPTVTMWSGFRERLHTPAGTRNWVMSSWVTG